MTDYIVYFSIILLVSILYVQYYKQYVFPHKVKNLNTAKDFRYARNLNAQLIKLLWLNAEYLKSTANIFEGTSFDATLDALINLRDKFYTTDNFKKLVGKQKAKRGYADTLSASIIEQIKMQHQVKDSFNKFIRNYNHLIAA